MRSLSVIKTFNNLCFLGEMLDKVKFSHLLLRNRGLFQKKNSFFLAQCAKSLGNRDLKGIRLRNKSISDEANQLRPLVKLVGNMHGNEPTGKEFCTTFCFVYTLGVLALSL